ncbi:MAG: FAD-dependent oxidoreductase [Bacillaceae bacterium]|nr:FAD-dependent oxidoreductase [Bacillaceae bacterium]
MDISDLKGLFQNHPLQFMKAEQEEGKLYSFFFLPERSFDWKPGQHGGLKVNGKTKPFTIGSTPKEGHIRIFTEMSDSEFKQSLLNLKEGDSASFNGPISNFYVKDPSQRHLFIADSVGVVAFRAILKDLIDRDIPLDNVHFLYFTSHSLFVDVLDQAKTKLATVRTINIKEELEENIEEYISQHQQNANYFISGKPEFSKQLIKLMKANGVTKIMKDIFTGY